MNDDRFNCLEQRMKVLEDKIDNIMDLVVMGKHVAALARFLAWLGGIYIAVETYVKTFHKGS
jgi:hypothetical protein